MTAASTLRTAWIGLHSSGFVEARIAPKLIQSLQDARDNLDFSVAVAEGIRRPILIDLRQAEPLETEVRHHYSGRKLSKWFTAIALVVPVTPFGRMMGNIYLRIARPGIPIRLFDDYDEAVEWLKQ